MAGTDGPWGHSPSGPPEAGVALSISIPAGAIYRVGSPISLTVELRNVTPAVRAPEGPSLNGRVVRGDPRYYTLEAADLHSGRTLEARGDWIDDLAAFAGINGSFDLPDGTSHFGTIRVERLVHINSPGTYSIRVTAPVDIQTMNNKGFGPEAHVVLVSNTLAIDVLPARSPPKPFSGTSTVYEDEPGKAAAGLPSHGFALSLTLNWPKPYPGDPLNVTVELRNVSGRVLYVRFGSRRLDYDFRIVSERTGAVVPRNPQATFPRDDSSKPWDSRPIYPDTSVYTSVSLSSLYRFAQAGTYSVRVAGQPIIEGKRAHLQSNPIEVTFVTPPPTVPLQSGQRLLSYAIQTDRSTYVSGQTIRIRLTLTNLTTTPVAYSLDGPLPPCILIVVDDRGDAVPSSQGGRGRGPGRGAMVMPRLPPGATPFEWTGISTWGYHVDQPGQYTLTAKPDIRGDIFTPTVIHPFGSENASDSPPVKITILSSESARMTPAVTLSDPDIDAAFRPLMTDFRRLRSSLADFVAQLRRGAAARTRPDMDDWEARQQRLIRSVDDLAKENDSQSPYGPVIANFRGAALELGRAESCAIPWGDADGAGAALSTADYYYNAVKDELAAGEARITDAAYPPYTKPPKSRC